MFNMVGNACMWSNYHAWACVCLKIISKFAQCSKKIVLCKPCMSVLSLNTDNEMHKRHANCSRDCLNACCRQTIFQMFQSTQFKDVCGAAGSNVGQNCCLMSLAGVKIQAFLHQNPKWLAEISKTTSVHLNLRMCTNFAQEPSTFQLNCITSANAHWTRYWWQRGFAPPINVQTCLPKPCLMMLSDIFEARSADGKPLPGSVMNITFMMEFTNSRNTSCEFPLRLSCLRQDRRQNLQSQLKTHNSGLANLWNAPSLA